MPAGRAAAPRSFRDASYDALDREVEQQLQLPPGLLSRIRVRGERSNADQVSSAGARSVYQIIPQTRSGVMKNYGVDAYAGPRQAALAAGYVLKEGLDRNRGDVAAAVAEYHGGIDRRGHGPVNRAYVARVTGGSAQPSRQSTFDRVKAKRTAAAEAEAGPSLAKVYAAYRQGRMSPEQAAQFEHDVSAGAVLLPPGGKLKRTPAAPTLPAGVVRAYNDTNSGMTIEQRQQIDADMRDGVVAVPRGAKLNPWRPATAGETFTRQMGLGTRAVIEGAGDIAGFVMNPVNTALNATGIPQKLTGKPLAMANDPEINIADKLGLPKPQFDSEQTMNAVARGATGGLLTYGIGSAASAAPGVTGAVGRAVASASIADVVSGGAAGGSAELARQEGFGPVGQTVAGLLGGGVGVAGALGAERVAARVRPDAPALPNRPPRDVVVGRNGDLTDEGEELVTRYGLSEDDVRRAYADDATPEAAASAPAPSAASTPDGVPPSPAREKLRVARAAVEEMSPARASDADLPSPVPPQPSQTTRSTPDIEPAPAPPSGPAAGRVAEAERFGIPLTRGQATQDFAVQDTEQTLRAQASGEGEAARQFLREQAEKIQDATVRFREAFGPTDGTRTDRGQQVKDALRDLRDQGKAGINTLYREANAIGGDGIALDTQGIADAAKRVLVEADVPDPVKNVVRQELARYGMLGKEAVTAEDGLTTVKLSDGRKVQFYGEPEALTLGNAEKLRKAISAQYRTDGPLKLSQRIKAAIDDAVEGAVETAARGGANTPVGAKLKEARRAVVAQKETFEAKDVVQRLIDYKKGTRTEVVLPERAVAEVLAGEVSNLKRVKAVLLSSPTPQTKAAWRAIQAEGVGDLFSKAYTVNANLGDGVVGTISGAKLNTAIERVGLAKLRVLLDEADLGRLMSLKRAIGNATVPIQGTTNPSGSAFKLMRFLTPLAAKFSGLPLVGPAVDVASGLVKQARATADAQRTLEGMRSYTAASAAREAAPTTKPAVAAKVDEAINAFLRTLIEAGESGRLAPAMLATQADRADPSRTPSGSPRP
jgi:hypothetical protein